MEGMTFLHTATESFDKTTVLDVGRFCTGPSCPTDAVAHWDGYISWSKMHHLEEVVSLDCMLNASLVDPDYKDADDWHYIYTSGKFMTPFYTALDYVLRRVTPKDKFNLLTVIINPSQNCRDIVVDGYQFMGYELLDQEFGNSALTNCGGFDESFLPSDLNKYGLIDEYDKAYAVRKLLADNNPDQHHAQTNLIAVWRHKEIGRQKNNFIHMSHSHS